MPIDNWWRMQEGNIQELVIRGDYSNAELYLLWITIMQDFQDAFGVNKEHKSILKAKMNYALAMCKYLKTQRYADKMRYEMRKTDLDDLLKKDVPKAVERAKLHEIITAIEYNLGFRISINKLSVFDFYRYKKQVENTIQAEKEHLEKIKNKK